MTGLERKRPNPRGAGSQVRMDWAGPTVGTSGSLVSKQSGMGRARFGSLEASKLRTVRVFDKEIWRLSERIIIFLFFINNIITILDDIKNIKK